jgi:hypothetical protein
MLDSNLALMFRCWIQIWALAHAREVSASPSTPLASSAVAATLHYSKCIEGTCQLIEGTCQLVYAGPVPSGERSTVQTDLPFRDSRIDACRKVSLPILVMHIHEPLEAL